MNPSELIPPAAQRALEAVEREAPEYLPAFGQFLFEEVLGIPWKRDLPPLTADDELYVPSSPDREA